MLDKPEKSQIRCDKDIDLVPSNVQSAHHEALLKHRTLCWSILDIKLSFLPCFCEFFQILDIVSQFCGIFGGFRSC